MGLKKILAMASLAVGASVAPVSEAQAQPRPNKNAPRVENRVSAHEMKKQQKKEEKKAFVGGLIGGFLSGLMGQQQQVAPPPPPPPTPPQRTVVVKKTVIEKTVVHPAPPLRQHRGR